MKNRTENVVLYLLLVSKQEIREEIDLTLTFHLVMTNLTNHRAFS